MNTPVEWIVISCGVVTFLLRLVPMWVWPIKEDAKKSTNAAYGALNSIGPAAVTALLVASLWPGADKDQYLHALPAMIAGLATVMGVKRAFGGIAMPTLLGAIVYGVSLQLIGL